MNSLQECLDRQKNFFASGATKPIEFRIKQLKNLLLTMKNMEAEILAALKSDLGRSELESFAAEVGFVYREIEHTIKILPKWSRMERVGTPLLLAPGRSYRIKEPKGVVLIIGAWNYPFQLVLAPLVGAIAAGNCIVVKPSEFAKTSEAVLTKLIAQAFVPDYCQIQCGGAEIANQLTRMPFAHIFFTGSTKVGKIVMENAARNLVPLTLELGGKSPAIVDKNTNLSLSAKRIVHGKFFNAGQTCVAPDYVLVHESIYDVFLNELKKWTKFFFGDNPEKCENYARIINDVHFDRILALLSDGTVFSGGGYNSSSRYIAPTILKDVSLDSKLMTDEIFGPLLPVVPYNTVDDLLKIVERNPHPLSCYIFTKEKTFYSQIIERLSFGGGCINSTLIHLVNSNLPFGGVGESGFGSYHGKKSLEIFSHEKSILKSYFFFDFALRYVPHGGTLNLIKLLFRL